MPRKDILLLDQEDSPWKPFLEEFLDDTPSSVRLISDGSLAGLSSEQEMPRLVFLDPSRLTLSGVQKLRAVNAVDPSIRFFGIGEGSRPDLSFAAAFGAVPPETLEFQKTLIANLELPASISLLVVDDEPEIGHLMKDYLEGRQNPSFRVRWEANGRLGLEAIEKEHPDVLVLDIKMPELDGREVYREILRRGWTFPVIVFFDAITGEEASELREMGRPMIVDKGTPRATIPFLGELIQKAWYFCREA